MRRIALIAIGLSLTLGSAGVSAAVVGPGGAFSGLSSIEGQGLVIHDPSLPPPAPNTDDSGGAASPSTASSAEAVPELPTWAMMLLCLAGFGLATVKRGRKDRLSPGIQ